VSDSLTGFLVAIAISASVGWLMIRIGPRFGWIDRPDDPTMKSHRIPAVPLGGIGIWTAATATGFIFGEAHPSVVLSSTMLVLLGLADDRFSIRPRVRLAVEAGAGLVLGLGRGHGLAEGLAVAVIVVIAVNAVNLFDGLDGGSGLIAMLSVAALASTRGESAVFAMIVAGALVGFLAWNWHPARLFLGDNGSYVLAGFLVAGFDGVSTTLGELAVAAALLGVYLIDIAATVIRRIIVSQPMFSRDRLHLYDRLVALGLSIPRIALASATLEAFIGLLVVVVDSSLSTAGAIVVVFLVGALLVAGLVKLLGATRPGFWTGQ
jgi:UDP-GlcNAc:undecaprenyl-phosphate GlcNAc-1-phosphate transferase